jgi:hypothetical protein
MGENRFGHRADKRGCHHVPAPAPRLTHLAGCRRSDERGRSARLPRRARPAAGRDFRADGRGRSDRADIPQRSPFGLPPGMFQCSDRPRPGLQFFGIPARAAEQFASPRRLTKDSLFGNSDDGQRGRSGPESHITEEGSKHGWHHS